jgi:hypothetical protein
VPDERKAISLRLSPDMWEQISRVAQHELRSINAQIEFMLREGLKSRGLARDEDVKKGRQKRGDG